MKTTLVMIEHYLLHAAVVMFLVLCAFSVFENVRSLLRISEKRKRTVRVAQALLTVFSLMAVMYGLVELGLIASLNRWD